MCGFVGFASNEVNCDVDFLRKAQKTIDHRGPDSNGIWISEDGSVGLAHQRLSIIDISSAGNQPMVSANGRYIIVFNGEIYNHLSLRKKVNKLQKYSWNSNSDTETLLACIQLFGLENTLREAIGMFSLCLYDKKLKRIHFARDRAGEKPLFYIIKSNKLYFASELKALLIHEDLPRKINIDSLDCYLTMGYVPGELCILSGYKKLAPAHGFTFDLRSGQQIHWKYWDLPELNTRAQKGNVNIQNLLDELDQLLEDSVGRQMIADVPVGVLLSGGVDSSLITSMAVRNSSNVNTFCIGFPGHSHFDETDHARLISNHFGTNHTELIAEPATAELIPSLAVQFDEPIVDSSMIPTYLVSNLVSKKCKVALGGDGGDELFGGYGHYRKLQIINNWRKYIPDCLIKSAKNLGQSFLPIGFKGRNWLQTLDFDLYRELPLIGTHFDINSRKKLFFHNRNWRPVAERIYMDRVISSPDILQRATRTDFENYLSEDILVKVDRASMMNSLELRAPFLDFRIIEFAFSRVPSSMKVNSTNSKILLKYLAKRLMPKEFNYHRKQGFSIPLSQWLKDGPFRELFWDTLDCNDTLLDSRFIRKLLFYQDKGYSNGERLFSLVQLELWRRKYSCYL